MPEYVEDIIITAVRERPHLYDQSRKDYRDCTKRDNAFNSIGQSLGMSGEEVAKKWRGLRDRFNKERKLLMEKMRNGDAISATPTCRWKFYKSLLFLTDHVKPRNTGTFIPSDAQPAFVTDTEMFSELPSPDLDEPCVNVTLESFHTSPESDHCSHNGPHSYAASERSVDECLSPASMHTPPADKGLQPPMKHRRVDEQRDVMQVLKSFGAIITKQLESNLMDAEMAFGINIAERLRSLTPRQSKLAQLKIQQVLFDIEFESMENK